MNIKNLIQKSINRGMRSITGRQHGGCLTWMVRTTSVPMLDVEISKDCPTADWQIDPSSGRHKIRMGVKLDQLSDPAKVTTDAKRIDHLYAVLRHEAEHGIQTTRLATVVQQLKDKRIPFALLNLFEDARIEYNGAKRPKADGGEGAFRWSKYEADMPEETAKATMQFYALKYAEAGLKKQPSAYLKRWLGIAKVQYKGKEKPTHLCILDFYRRVIAAPSTMYLIPILVEWVKIFGAEIDTPRVNEVIDGKTDKEVSDVEDTSQVETLTGASTSVGSRAEQKSACASWVTSRPHNVPIDQALVDRLYRAMKQMVTRGSQARSERGSRGGALDVSRVITGSTDVFRRRGDVRGRRSTVLVVDWSGSMGNTWSRHGGKELFLAMRKLHRTGVIDLEVIFTRDNGRMKGRNSVMDKGASQVAEERIAQSKPNGDAEFVLSAMKANREIIKRAKSVVVFTDGRLHDSHTDLNQFKSMGVRAIATMIQPNPNGVNRARSDMNRFFSRSLVATHASELAKGIVKEVLKDV